MQPSTAKWLVNSNFKDRRNANVEEALTLPRATARFIMTYDYSVGYYSLEGNTHSLLCVQYARGSRESSYETTFHYGGWKAVEFPSAIDRTATDMTILCEGTREMGNFE